MKGIFITATDTDAGKTYVTRLLVRALRERGVNAIGYKPIACGDRGDARLLRDELGEAGKDMRLELINPVYMKNSTAPYTASLLEGTEVDVPAMLEGAERLGEVYEWVLVEGVGGWEVPLTRELRMSDYARKLGLPVVVVLENKLGMLNHAILTVNAVKASGLRCLGVIINNRAEEWTTAQLTNRGVVSDVLDVPVLAELIAGQDFIDVDDLLARMDEGV